MKAFALLITLTLLATCSPITLAQEPEQHRPRIALALGGGGGARGAAHIGVLRVFEQEHIPVDFIVGTSMGAIVGGLYAAGTPLERIELMLRNKSLLHAYNTVPIPVRAALIPIFFVVDMFGKHPYDGLYRGNRFAKFIDRQVSPENRQIENLKIPFWAVATDLLEGKTYVLKHGDLGRALQASSGIPFLRRPVPIDNRLLCDGGVLANVPTFEAKGAGADFVVAVNVDELIKPATWQMFKEFGSVPNRALSLILDQFDEAREKASDLVIQPDVSGMTLLSQKIADANAAIVAGEKAARYALPRIRELLQRRQAVARP